MLTCFGMLRHGQNIIIIITIRKAMSRTQERRNKQARHDLDNAVLITYIYIYPLFFLLSHILRFISFIHFALLHPPSSSISSSSFTRRWHPPPSSSSVNSQAAPLASAAHPSCSLPRSDLSSPLGRQESDGDGLLTEAAVFLLVVEPLSRSLVSERNEERLRVGSLECHRGLRPPLC